jgi:hypothetical protein
MTKSTLVVVTGATILFFVAVTTLIMIRERDSVSISEDKPAVSVGEGVSSLLQNGDYDGATKFLESQRQKMSATEFEVQKNRILTIQSYDEFYGNNTDESQANMLNDVIARMDAYFEIVNSSESGNSDKATALNAIAFLYSETWSHPILLQHIATKLGIVNFNPNDNFSKAAVFNELFTRSIAFFPTQEAYLKRAWFNSRVLLTEKEVPADVVESMLQGIESDVATSNAATGMRFNSSSRYYNAYTALAYADVLDLLFQAKRITDPSFVDTAYMQALSLANSDFFGNLIIQDIIRMNHAASMYRRDDVGERVSDIVEILLPVARNIQEYSGKSAIAYEGILVMLQGVPEVQNQNNAAIYEIFRNFAEFEGIPDLLGWKIDSSNDRLYDYKLI